MADPILKVARRVGIALGSFVIALVAISLVAVWLFGSSNFLAYVLAAVIGAGTYLAILGRDRRVG
jgi:apolipoprotein N-acyltransferase